MASFRLHISSLWVVLFKKVRVTLLAHAFYVLLFKFIIERRKDGTMYALV